MALERQVTFWVAALAVFVAVLWLLSEVLLPFVAGMALAYLLDPVARRAERLGIGRAVSALIVLTLVIVAVVVVVGYAAAVTWVLLKLVNAAFGIRVSSTEEQRGLDASQHGEVAYQS